MKSTTIYAYIHLLFPFISWIYFKDRYDELLNTISYLLVTAAC